MPTYAYECTACGHRFEEFQTMTAAPLRKCPECKKTKLQRLIGAGAGVIFKGSGFYETDYKKPARGGDKVDKKSDGDGSAKTDDSKGDAGKADGGSKGDGGSKSEPAKADKKAPKSDRKGTS